MYEIATIYMQEMKREMCNELMALPNQRLEILAKYKKELDDIHHKVLRAEQENKPLWMRLKIS